jgi:hypothetical protein
MAKPFSLLRDKLPQEAFPKVMIAIIAQEQSRYTKFWAAFNAVMMTTPNCHITYHVGNQLTKARNDAVEVALAHNCDYLWFIDDDHDFKPDTLRRLLAHGKDIVGPLYCIRGYPFHPTARRLDGTAKAIFNVPASGSPALHQVRGTGTSGMLINTEVFRQIPRPWFVTGHINPEEIAEDFFFCEKAQDYGYSIYLDTSTTLEHFVTMKASIEYMNNAWHIVLDVGEGRKLPLLYNVNETEDQTVTDGTKQH